MEEKKFKKILIYLSTLIFIILVCITFATISINNYLNSNQEKDLSKLLKIKGSLTFQKSSTDILSHFPNAIIKFKNVVLKDKKIALHKHIPFEAKTIVVKIKLGHWNKNIFELTQIDISDAKVDLYVDENNYSNIRHIFNREQEASNSENNFYLKSFKNFLSKGKVKLKTENTKINLSHIDLKIVNIIRKKDISLHINKLNTIIFLTDSLSSKSNISGHINKLTFNTAKGPFLKDTDLEGEIKGSLEEHILNVHTNNFKTNNKTYKIVAKIDLALGSKSQLHINQEHTVYKEISPLLSTNIQNKIKKYNILGDFQTKTYITFVPWRKDPSVIIKFCIPQNTIIIKGHKIDSTHACGKFTNRIYNDIRRKTENRKNISLTIDSATCEYKNLNIKTHNTQIISSPDLEDNIFSKIAINSDAKHISKLLKSKRLIIQNGKFSLIGQINGSLESIKDILRKSYFNAKFKNLDVFYTTSGINFTNNFVEFNKGIGKTEFIFRPHITPNGQISISGNINNIENLIFANENHKTESDISIIASNLDWEELISSLKNKSKNKKLKKYSTPFKNSLSEIYLKINPHIHLKINKLIYSKDIVVNDIKAQILFKNSNSLIIKNTSFKFNNSDFKLTSNFVWSKYKNIQISNKINIKELQLSNFLPKFDYFGINLLHSVKDYTNKINLDLVINNELNESNKISFENLYANMKFRTITKSKHIYVNSQKSKKTHYKNNYTNLEDITYGSIELKFIDNNNVKSSISINTGTPFLNNFLKSDKFNFTEGHIKMNFNITGNLKTTLELIQKSKGSISLLDGRLEIKKSNTIIPIDTLNILLDNDIASYHIKLQHNLEQSNILNINGKIKNISSFIFNNSSNQTMVNARISSNTFDWNKFKKMFSIVNPNRKKEIEPSIWDPNIATNNLFDNNNLILSKEYKKRSLKKRKEININNIIESFKSLALTFNPTISLDIDNIIFPEILVFSNLSGSFSIINNIIDINNISLNYHNGYSKIKGKIDIGKKSELPIHLKIESKKINLKKILEDFKYFNISSLKNTEKLQGLLSANMNFNTSFNLYTNKNIANKTNLDISYSIDSVEIKGFKIIDEIAKKIGSRKRLKYLKFAPINGNFNFDGYTYSVPMTELQSNAFQMFVKGRINTDKTKDLWLIIPYSNFKRHNLNFIPSLTGFLSPRKKIYIHLINNFSTKFKNKTHINLSPKKFEEISKANK